MLRWLFHILCLLSLLLCIAVISIWIYGRWHDIKVEVARGLKPRTRPGYWVAARPN